MIARLCAAVRDYADSTYGDRIASVYDEWYVDAPSGGDLDATVSFLRAISSGATALELGIGTGRVALPLKGAGSHVHGIDASEAMVARLRAKPGGADVPVTIGSFADFDLGRGFDLIYVVFNTFFALASQDEQVACFEAVARHLNEGGVFAMEAFVPDLGRYQRSQHVGAAHVGLDEVRLDVSTLDPSSQVVLTQHVVLSSGDARIFPVRIRFAWPAELDLMARLAGLRLQQRWGDWDRTPFRGDGPKHVSVWDRST
jgi:SAM-dependent methyltransferase